MIYVWPLLRVCRRLVKAADGTLKVRLDGPSAMNRKTSADPNPSPIRPNRTTRPARLTRTVAEADRRKFRSRDVQRPICRQTPCPKLLRQGPQLCMVCVFCEARGSQEAGTAADPGSNLLETGVGPRAPRGRPRRTDSRAGTGSGPRGRARGGPLMRGQVRNRARVLANQGQEVLRDHTSLARW